MAIKQREETLKPRHNENQPEPNQDRRQEPKQTRQYVSSVSKLSVRAVTWQHLQRWNGRRCSKSPVRRGFACFFYLELRLTGGAVDDCRLAPPRRRRPARGEEESSSRRGAREKTGTPRAGRDGPESGPCSRARRLQACRAAAGATALGSTSWRRPGDGRAAGLAGFGKLILATTMAVPRARAQARRGHARDAGLGRAVERRRRHPLPAESAPRPVDQAPRGERQLWYMASGMGFQVII